MCCKGRHPAAITTSELDATVHEQHVEMQMLVTALKQTALADLRLILSTIQYLTIARGVQKPFLFFFTPQ